MYNYGAQVAYCSQFDKLPQAMSEVRPTVIVGVPRVFEKIRQAVEQKAECLADQETLLAWALKLGAHHRDTVYDGRQPTSLLWKVANKLVYSKVREAFGGRVASSSPAARLSASTPRAGLPQPASRSGRATASPKPRLSSPSIHPAVHRMGAVGMPLTNVELKLAEDGELLVRGPSVFAGYWQKPEANAECFDGQGWFRTGDIAHLDADGFLYITDRKKELLKTSGGKLVAPQPIENKLKNSFGRQCALVGDRHKFISALISPNFAALEDWAKHCGLDAVDRARSLLPTPASSRSTRSRARSQRRPRQL